MKTVFVTGSEGFVGTHVINELKKDYSIIGLSRNTPLKSSENLTYIIGDILDQNKVYEILNQYKPDVILHLAGIAKTWGNDPKVLFDINLNGTLNIYETVLKLKKENNFDPKIIFISSAEVYGNIPHPESIDENAPLLPVNTYGVSKLAADRLSYQYSQTYKLNIIILRPFPHIGSGQNIGFFVSDMASQIVGIEKDPSKDTLLVGNLESIRDYLDVRDVTNAYKIVIETEIDRGEVFNICSGKEVKIKDILDKLLKLAKKEIKIMVDPTRIREVDLPIYVGNNKKLVSKTPWQPNYALDQTLQDVMEYWRGKNG